MRLVLALVLCGLGAVACSHPGKQKRSAAPEHRSGASAPLGTGAESALIVTPETGLSGKVAMVNSDERFVVLNFPIGRLPAMEQRLNVYHLGLKVGEVTITGPQTDDNIVGNLTTGQAAVGDVVRDR